MATLPLTTTVVDSNAWDQLLQIDAPSNSPVSTTVGGVAPVQSWDETQQVLPNIGDVDNKILGAAGMSNTILISTTTAEILRTITVSIGANGNWYVGNQDTGVAATGTNPQHIPRPTGLYTGAAVEQLGAQITFKAGGQYCTKDGSEYKSFTMMADTSITILTDTVLLTIDSSGVIREYPAGSNLWLIPESQALVAIAIQGAGGTGTFVMPTVHNAWVVASASRTFAELAQAAALAANNSATLAIDAKVSAASSALASANSAAAAHASELVTQSDALITTTNVTLSNAARDAAQSSASAAATSETNAAASAGASATSATASANSATASDASKVAAAGSATASSNSAALALGYKGEALAARDLASEWADKAEDAPITGNAGKYSSRHWASKAQQWAQVVGASLIWKGAWSAAANTAPPTPAVGAGAPFYRISAAGIINSVVYDVGDYIHWDTIGLQWFKVDGTDSVVTVNGQSGAVNLTAANVGAAPSSHVGAGSNAQHPDVTTTVSGFMTAADKVKLNGVAANANNYAHPAGDGNLHVPATSTSNNNKFLMAGPTAGSIAWQALTAANITGVLPLAGGYMTGPISANAQKSAITVNSQGSISYQDAGQTVFHTMAFGNTLAIAKNVAGDSTIWSIGPSGVTQQVGPMYSKSGAVVQSPDGTKWLSMETPDGAAPYMAVRSLGETAPSVTLRFGAYITAERPVLLNGSTVSAYTLGRSWASYGTANYAATEYEASAGTLRAALSYPFKITGNYALDAYVGTYATSTVAGGLNHVLGFTDGNTYNKVWLFAADGTVQYWSTPGNVATITSLSPMVAPSFTPSSDGRLKPQRTRTPLQGATEFVKALKPQRFYKTYVIDGEQGQWEYGLIADEVEPLKDDIVRTAETGDKLKGVDWTGISAHLVAAFQELEQRVTNMEGAHG